MWRNHGKTVKRAEGRTIRTGHWCERKWAEELKVVFYTKNDREIAKIHNNPFKILIIMIIMDGSIIKKNP